MELMEKLTKQRIKIEATNDISTPDGRNPQNSGDIHETGSTDSIGDENALHLQLVKNTIRFWKIWDLIEPEYSYDDVLLLFTGAIMSARYSYRGSVCVFSLLLKYLNQV